MSDEYLETAHTAGRCGDKFNTAECPCLLIDSEECATYCCTTCTRDYLVTSVSSAGCSYFDRFGRLENEQDRREAYRQLLIDMVCYVEQEGHPLEDAVIAGLDAFDAIMKGYM